MGDRGESGKIAMRNGHVRQLWATGGLGKVAMSDKGGSVEIAMVDTDG